MGKKITDEQKRVFFDCSKCPAYCCGLYERIQVTKRDLNRLAKHFGVTVEKAAKRYTKMWDEKERVLKRTPDPILGEACQLLDPEPRGRPPSPARPPARPRAPAPPTEPGRTLPVSRSRDAVLVQPTRPPAGVPRISGSLSLLLLR